MAEPGAASENETPGQGAGHVEPAAGRSSTGWPEDGPAGRAVGSREFLLKRSFNVPLLLAMERKGAPPVSGEGWVRCPLRWRPLLWAPASLGLGGDCGLQPRCLEARDVPPPPAPPQGSTQEMPITLNAGIVGLCQRATSPVPTPAASTVVRPIAQMGRLRAERSKAGPPAALRLWRRGGGW